MHGPPRRRCRPSPSSTAATARPTRSEPCSRELTGQEVDESVALFPPFYSEFGKNLRLGKASSSTSAAASKTPEGSPSATGSLIGHGSTLTTLNHARTPAGGPTWCPRRSYSVPKVWLVPG